MHASLLILAAGMGSRYGGLKQLEPMGPNGETVLDYSVFDAIRAGFTKVIFVIRRDFEALFKSTIGASFEDQIEVVYAFQELADLPKRFNVPEGREKPWGTAHALRAARDQIDAPFAVINADDFYGQDAYMQVAQYFAQDRDQSKLRSCMVGYPLQHTLSTHGSVNRGICQVQHAALRSVEEHSALARKADGTIRGHTLIGQSVEIAADAIVSMNFWGFTPTLLPRLEAIFIEFLNQHGQEMNSECYIPSVVDDLIRSRQTECAVIETSGTWFGVTYPEDKALVQAGIAARIAAGDYPHQLWTP